MRIMSAVYGCLRPKLSQPTAADGRIWVILALLCYFGSLWVANFFVPYSEVWRRAGVPTMTPIFADLRAILAGFECTRLGYDVLYAMPCDPYNRGSLAYPRLWMALEWTGLNLGDSIVLGVLSGISFYTVTLAFAGRLNKYEAVIYVLILCSPPAMLLVERANVDILMYDLLFLVLLGVISKRPIARLGGYALILIPSFLKLLPIFSLGVALSEKKRWHALGIMGVVATIFGLYCIATRTELKVFRSFYGYGIWYASGVKILPTETWRRVVSLVSGGDHGSLPHLSLAVFVLVVVAAFAWLFLRLVLRQLVRLKQWLDSRGEPQSSPVPDQASVRRLAAFRIGSCVYLGTFLLTIAHDYKLAFLLFTFPQLLFWIKHDRQLGPSASIALVGIVATFYANPFLYRWLVDEMINWGIAGYLIFALLVTLPHWAKAWAKDGWSRGFRHVALQ